MTSSNSPIADYFAAPEIPDGLRETYAALRNEVVELNARWIVFKQLFASGNERIGLFTSAAPSFFSMVHDSMRDGIFLQITRLTDRRKDTLSLPKLLAQTKKVLKPNAIQSLDTLLCRIREEQRPFKDWRDNVGAHNNLQMLLQQHLMPKIMFDSVGIVLGLIGDLLNDFGRQFGYPDADFASVIVPGDGDAIVRSLERSIEHRNCRIGRTNQG